MHLKNEISVKVNAATAWQYLGQEFGNIGNWITALESSYLIGTLGLGAVRVCQSKGFGPFAPSKATERIIHFDADKYEFTYIAETGIPKAIASAQNAWSIIPIDKSHCIVKFHATISFVFWFKPFAWLVPWLMKRDMRILVEEIKHMIEQGKANPRKIHAMNLQSNIT